jgi:hypothetical protein
MSSKPDTSKPFSDEKPFGGQCVNPNDGGLFQPKPAASTIHGLFGGGVPAPWLSSLWGKSAATSKAEGFGTTLPPSTSFVGTTTRTPGMGLFGTSFQPQPSFREKDSGKLWSTQSSFGNTWKEPANEQPGVTPRSIGLFGSLTIPKPAIGGGIKQ